MWEHSVPSMVVRSSSECGPFLSYNSSVRHILGGGAPPTSVGLQITTLGCRSYITLSFSAYCCLTMKLADGLTPVGEVSPQALKILIISGAFFTMALTAIAFRIWARKIKGHGLSWNDYAMLAAMV